MPGRTLLHYEIVEKVGEGGMGVVYKARDPRLQRYVALKVLPEATSADPRRRARLLREARAAATLSHPHIVTVHDIASDGGTDFIVMEHVEGWPLSRVIPARGLSVADALRYAVQIADALAAAHAAGVVHRDLKPGNVVVTPEGRAKVLDFGLARFDTESGDGATGEPLTQEGALLGTITYMSPEQSIGEAADAQSDVYSFGAMLYEMLAGEPPFHGRTTAEQFHLLQYGTPKPLRERRTGVPEALEAAVLKALARSRQERWADMRSLETELRRVAGEVAALLPEEQTPLDTEAPTLAHVPVPRSRPPGPGSERTSIAVLPFTSLSRDADDALLAAGIASEIIVALAGVPDLRVAAELASSRFQGPGLDLAEIARTLAIRYALTGTLRRAGDRIRLTATLADASSGTQIWSRAYERRIEDLFRVQEEIARAIVGATGGQLIRADSERASRSSADHLDAWGLVRKAYSVWTAGFRREGIDEGLELLRRAVKVDPAYAVAHAALGFYLIQRFVNACTGDPEGERSEALASVERAVSLAPRDTRVLEYAGLVWYDAGGHHERSVGALRQCVEIAPFNLVGWGYLALSLGWAGNDAGVEEARRLADTLIADTPDHPSLPFWLFFRSGIATRQGCFEDASADARRSLQMIPMYFVERATLANALGHLGRAEEARAEMSACLAANPAFTPEHYARTLRRITGSDERLEPLVAGLRAAGLL